MNKKKLNRLINIIFIVYILFCAFYNGINLLTEENMTLEILKNMSFLQIIASSLLLVFISLLTTFINNIVIIAIFFGSKLALKRFYKSKLDFSDLKKYEGYYRDLINNYSIGLLDYLDDFKIDYETLCISTLLKLQNEKIIDIKNNKINIIGNPTNETDKLFLSYIKDNKVNIDENIFKEQIIREAKKESLLKDGGKIKNLKQIILIFLLIPISSLILTYIAYNFKGVSVFSSLTIVLLVIIAIIFVIAIPGLIFFSISYYTMYFTKQLTEPYVRTEEGKEVNEKLEGLKNYLKDFGNFEDKSSKDLVLWEDYLIYSVMFNINTKTINEYKKWL